MIPRFRISPLSHRHELNLGLCKLLSVSHSLFHAHTRFSKSSRRTWGVHDFHAFYSLTGLVLGSWDTLLSSYYKYWKLGKLRGWVYAKFKNAPIICSLKLTCYDKASITVAMSMFYTTYVVLSRHFSSSFIFSFWTSFVTSWPFLHKLFLFMLVLNCKSNCTKVQIVLFVLLR